MAPEKIQYNKTYRIQDLLTISVIGHYLIIYFISGCITIPETKIENPIRSFFHYAKSN